MPQVPTIVKPRTGLTPFAWISAAPGICDVTAEQHNPSAPLHGLPAGTLGQPMLKSCRRQAVTDAALMGRRSPYPGNQAASSIAPSASESPSCLTTIGTQSGMPLRMFTGADSVSGVS